MLFYRVRYSFRASQSMPGTTALWRTVEANTPLHEYESGSWGPKEAEAMVPGGWYLAPA